MRAARATNNTPSARAPRGVSILSLFNFHQNVKAIFCCCFFSSFSFDSLCCILVAALEIISRRRRRERTLCLSLLGDSRVIMKAKAVCVCVWLS